MDQALDGMCKALTDLVSDYRATALPELRCEAFEDEKGRH